MNIQKKAFSLVELSIVLIIIGLLVAGVSGGSKLIKSAKINKLISEINQIKSNVPIFKLIYKELPGDFADAQSFWGSTGNLDNGNGNGTIESPEEKFDAFLHMAKAELINDIGFTGTITTYTNPISSIDGVASSLMAISSLTAGEQANHYNQGDNIVQIGKGALASSAFLIPKDAYKIDKKLDDGLPKSGNVTFRNAGNSTDANCTNSSTSYYLSSVTEGCNLIASID